MIRRAVIRLSMLLALSFPVSAFSQQASTDSFASNDAGASAPAEHHHDAIMGGDDGMSGDHDMSGDHEGMSGDDDMSGHDMGEHDMGGHHHRVDHHDPAFLMFTHVLQQGEWMIGYRYTNSYLGGDQTGTTPLSTQAAFNAPGGGMYMMVPTGMTMEMHMLDIMRGITDDFTLYLMPTWTDNTMNMLMSDGTTFRMTNGGFSDLPLGALWRIYHGQTDDVVLNIGFTAPTGDIHNMTMMPMGMGMSMLTAFPYTMRLGNGTWDACPGITYKHYWEQASFGFQGTFDLPMGLNDEQCRVGNQYRATAWLAYLLDRKKSLAATFRVEGLWRSNYVGVDPQLDATMMSDNDPTMRGGDFLNLGAGFMFMLPKHLGLIEGEYLQPVVQNVRGIQETTIASFAVRYIAMF